MGQIKKIPKLRFKGFTEEWEERELGEIVLIQRGGSPRPIEDFISTSANGTNWIKIGDVATDSRYITSTKEKIIVSGESKSRKVFKGDLILSNSMSFGRPYIMKIEGCIHDGWLLIRDIKNIFEKEYLLQLLSSDYMFKQYKSLAAGGVVNNLNSELVKSTIALIPNKVEQSKIGNCFKNLDTLITLHQQKYDKLNTVKKAMLEKMFPREGADVPEIRFKGFTEEWKRKKIGDILTETKRPIELEDRKQYELVTVKRRNDGVVSRGMLKGKDILVKNYFAIRAGDYIISKRQIVHGANGIVPQNLNKAIVSNEYLVAVGNDNITTEFWTVISKLPDMYKKFFLSSYGVDIEKLVFDVEDWKKRVIVIPTVSEQNRITGFFKSLDSLISLHQRELDKLKNIKKACLEKMFV